MFLASIIRQENNREKSFLHAFVRSFVRLFVCLFIEEIRAEEKQKELVLQ